ncbi:MAG: MFS transporter [Lachnospiraceae bacterium]|nr:MFS transporter [Lachnospiraceae bacterium]
MRKNTNTLDPNAKLSWLERIAYGIGDYAGNLVYSAISAFLLVYYVSVVGLPSATAAGIMAISKIFDGVSDLIMGRIVDKTHTKWGKARPWILRASIPLAICTVLMFTVPAGFSTTLKICYAFLTYNLVSTVFYTALNVPYATMQGLMTTNSYERGLLGNFRMLLATFGTMTVNSVVTPLVKYFGGDEYSQKGWTLTFIVLMVCFLLLNLIMFFVCKERVVEEPDESAQSTKAQGPTVMECLKSLVQNKYWVLMVVFLFVLYFMMSTFFGGNYYFAQYVLKNEGAYSILANALSLSQMGMMFLTPFIMKKLGKRWTTLIGMIASGVAFILTAVAVPTGSIGFVVACNVLKGLGFGCGAATMFGMLQDAITYGQWKSNVQAAGMGNAASSFCMKIGSGIGTAALGWILSAGGFDADPTSAAAVASINVAVIWIPLIIGVISVVCLLLFDIEKKYDKVVEDLAAGRWAGSDAEADNK